MLGKFEIIDYTGKYFSINFKVKLIPTYRRAFNKDYSSKLIIDSSII